MVLEEVHRVFAIEDRYNRADMMIARTMRLGDFTGQPVSAVRPAREFVCRCRPPNAAG